MLLRDNELLFPLRNKSVKESLIGYLSLPNGLHKDGKRMNAYMVQSAIK